MKRPMDSSNKPSLNQIAKAAGVSVATVSRVARGQVNVASEIRLRVYKAARVLGVDLERRRSERSTIVAFLLSNRDVLHSFQSQVLLGAEAYCAAQNRELLFMSIRYSPGIPSKDLHLPHILTQRELVGAVILGGTNSPNIFSALRHREIPFAVLGNNVSGEWTGDEHDAVFSDDIQGAFDLTNHLISQGHRDIWFFGDIELPWYARCAKGYRQSMEIAGLQPRLSEIHSDDQQLGYLAMRSVLSRAERISAVFAGSDQIARGVYQALHQSGLRVPDDLTVAGFNDSEGSLMQPSLTSVAEFPNELGKHLAAFALTRMQQPGIPPQQLTIPTRVVLRDSTRNVLVHQSGSLTNYTVDVSEPSEAQTR